MIRKIHWLASSSPICSRLSVLGYVLAFVFGIANLTAQQAERTPSGEFIKLSNSKVEFSLLIDSGKIVSDELSARPGWAQTYGFHPSSIETDGNFSMEIMWTDWSAPKKINNAENPAVLGKSDFVIKKHEFKDLDHGTKELTVSLTGKDFPLEARITYRLDSNAFYVRRKLTVIDTSRAGHFLQKIYPIAENIVGKWTDIKDGGFGQPVALQRNENGAFFGIEYPAADNSVVKDGKGLHVFCGHEVGERIEADGVASEWAVEGITPDPYVKLWFMKYVDDIRVAPLRPYTLYNSWYDLRSTEYPRVPEGNRMNEKNIFHIIDLMRKNMIEKHDIKLDAFVLDDGWDVYESDWVLRQKEFPHGLSPIVDELKKTNTNLGLWMGPTGGYSFRMKRINWMKGHGYEVVGNTPNTAMMCLAGNNYSALFKKRVTDFVANDGVGYFKWDGIQFSCSEPDHGHPVGIYSRRAVMESLIDKVHAVREKNPNIFLNITSGTWLSPWWVKYANTIWMQGSDYGYADVPSVSPRDAAITYRDFVLYDDFKNEDLWFPIANLMTHGIIKGNLEWLGGKEEPLDKFMNEVLLYFARGVAMWELYISPDILTDSEWDALGQAMKWARDRFPILSTSEMVGGDPTKRQPYGYVHFNGTKGIIAARNPWIESNSLSVNLDPAYGLNPSSDSLVLEKIYPTRWISPQLYHAGTTVDLAVDGYETAIFEIYPLSDATTPLIAGVPFEVRNAKENSEVISIYGTNQKPRLLNPETVGKVTSDGVEIHDLTIRERYQTPPIDEKTLTFSSTANEITLDVTIDTSVVKASLSVLLTPSKDSASNVLPHVNVSIDGKEDTAKYERGEAVSTWYTASIPSGKQAVKIRVVSRENDKKWSGHATVWAICQQRQKSIDLMLETSKPKGPKYIEKHQEWIDRVLESLTPISESPMPPRPFPVGVILKNVNIGETDIGPSQSTSQTVWLDELDLSTMDIGWGSPQAKKSVDGHPLGVGGQKFERGVGTHAVSTYLLNLNGKGKKFNASVGVDDEVDTTKASVEFFIVGDKKVLWGSGVMKKGDAPKKIDVDIANIKQLGLLVTDAGDGNGWDHADWCDAKIELTESRAPADFVIKSISEPYILTPKPSDNPRINGAKVFGVRPGHPFLYTIAATGKRPMTFEARYLPEGLILNSSSGQITGALTKPGDYKVTLVAKNVLGQSERQLRISVRENICLTPPMGWNSWNCWACSVDDGKVRASADAMVSSGLIDHGWTYINIDDCWEVKPNATDSVLNGEQRDKSGMINTNKKFPDMKALSDYVHSKGLKLGIYSGPGPLTCAGFTASYQHEQQDAQQYADWGLDYLKYDWCSYSQIAENRSVRELKKPYEVMRAALDKVPRDIVYSLCQYGMGNVWEWGADVGGNCWRTTDDITDTWESLSGIGFGQAGHEKHAGPGHWNDPDMLIVGLVGWGPKQNANIVLKSFYVGISGKFMVRDVWRQKDLGVFEKEFATDVPYHDVVLLRVTEEK